MKRFPKNKSELKKVINAFIMTSMGTSLDSFLSEYSDPHPRKEIMPECKENNHSFQFLTKSDCESLGISHEGNAKWGCIKCHKIVISM